MLKNSPIGSRRYPLIGILDAEAWPTYLSVVRAIELYFDGYEAQDVEHQTGVSADAVEWLCRDAQFEETALDNLRRGPAGDLRSRLERLAGLSANRRSKERMHLRRYNDVTASGMPDLSRGEAHGFRMRLSQGQYYYPVPDDLVGANCDMLPFESCISILGRIAAVNSLSSSMISRFVAPTFRSMRSPLPFTRLLRLDHSALWTTLGWGQSIEGLVVRSLPYLAGVLFAEQFKYCHECIAAGYHSAFHQLFFVQSCPIHGVPLSCVCPECHSETGEYGDVLYSGAAQFGCSCCAKPLCGRPFSFRSHYDFRTKRPQWFEKLVPMARWIGNSQRRLWGLERIIASNRDCDQSWAGWMSGSAIDFLRDAVVALHPPPASYVPRSSDRIRVLSWNPTSLLERNPASFLGNPVESAWRGEPYWKVRRKAVSVTYLGVLEALQRWLVKLTTQEELIAELKRCVDAFEDGQLVSLTGVDHRLISLAVLIFLCEGDSWQSRKKSLRGLLKDNALAVLGAHNCQAQCEAFLLGLYACILSGIKREASFGRPVSARWAVPLLSPHTVPHATLPGPSPYSLCVVSGGLMVVPEAESFLSEVLS